MNNYLFGGLISKRTFTLFLSAIAFFAILLGVGLGISAFAEGEDVIVYPHLEVTNVPDSLLQILDPEHEITASDFDGFTYNIVYPVGSEQNKNGTEDIIETITVDGKDIYNARVDYREGGEYVELFASHQSGTEVVPMTFYLSKNSPTVCDFCAVIGLYFDDFPMEDLTVVCIEEGFTFAENEDFEYFVGENETYVVYYQGEGGDVVVPSIYDGKPVTRILYHAFADTDKIKSITIPEGVTTIENEAFKYLKNLEEVNIPSTAVDFAVDAFDLIYNDLVAVNVAEGNTKVYNQNNDGALYYDNGDGTKQILIYPAASARTTFTVGNDVAAIAPYAFTDAINLTTVNMPDDADSKLETIGEGAFHTSGVTAIDLPSSVTEIGEYAFADCKNLSSLEIGGAKKIPYGMCDYYSYDENDVPSLKTFVVPEGVTFIDDFAFYNQPLTDITIPYSVNSIGFYSIHGMADAPVKIHGSAGTAAEEYCKKNGETYFVQFVNDVVDEFVSIPFEVVGGNNTYREFTVTVIDGENREETKISPNGNKNMVFCADIAEGKTVDIVISKKGYLDYTLDDFTVGEDEVPADIKLYPGDVDGNGYINIVDIEALITKNAMEVIPYHDHDYYENENFINYGHYDFDESGYINIIDIAAAIESFCAVNNAG